MRTAFIALLVLSSCAADSASVDGEEAEAAVVTEGIASTSIHVEDFEYPFENWDHDGKKVDHPVTIVFVSDRPEVVARVYEQVESVGLTHSGGKMTLSGIGGSRPGVNPTDPWTSSSAGRKGAFGCWGKCGARTDIHLRTYGPDGKVGTQVYQGKSGIKPYYLVATTHFDIDENTPQADFGDQDRARGFLVDELVAARKWRVLKSVDMKNACDKRLDARHLCRHDGKALVIDID